MFRYVGNASDPVRQIAKMNPHSLDRQTFFETRSLMSWAGLSAAHTPSSTLPDGLKVLKSSALYKWSGLSDRGGLNALRLQKKTSLGDGRRGGLTAWCRGWTRSP